MTPNLTVGYMAEQINRGRLDSVAARGWLTEEIGKLGLKVTPSVANFVLIHFPLEKGRTADDLHIQDDAARLETVLEFGQ